MSHSFLSLQPQAQCPAQSRGFMKGHWTELSGIASLKRQTALDCPLTRALPSLGGCRSRKLGCGGREVQAGSLALTHRWRLFSCTLGV